MAHTAVKWDGTPEARTSIEGLPTIVETQVSARSKLLTGIDENGDMPFFLEMDEYVVYVPTRGFEVLNEEGYAVKYPSE